MDIQQYVAQLKEQYKLLLEFLEDDVEIDEYINISKKFDAIKQKKNREELVSFLLLLLNILDNHARKNKLFQKTKKIILYFSHEIKQTLSNSEIFDIFKGNKLIILFLLKNQIITPDKFVTDFILSYPDYCHFFSPEIGLKTDDYSQDHNFEEKRQIGQNDSYICSLIRSDLIDDFVAYVSQTNLPISDIKIKPSIFETNSFLIDKHPTLIEYSAFFGSIQIFNFLRLNKVELTSSLWLYAIHSNNAELIHLLEANNVKPDDITYEECLFESIKCHHNGVANYIRNNFLIINGNSEQKICFLESLFSISLHYYNYSFFPNNVNQPFLFFYLCQYNHYYIVNLLMELKKNDIESQIVLKKNCFSFEIFNIIVFNSIYF
ncbi:hypothetical protein M9Y10_010683 [Tritrichomonas musculus]|uniref:DUF3447 domain-containing protein n=1 Tax=Tritrichomonas musculus TaxID=1915356 RepID=A0ABR2IMZ8_9EUKA